MNILILEKNSSSSWQYIYLEICNTRVNSYVLRSSKVCIQSRRKRKEIVIGKRAQLEVIREGAASAISISLKEHAGVVAVAAFVVAQIEKGKIESMRKVKLKKILVFTY